VAREADELYPVGDPSVLGATSVRALRSRQPSPQSNRRFALGRVFASERASACSASICPSAVATIRPAASAFCTARCVTPQWVGPRRLPNATAWRWRTTGVPGTLTTCRRKDP